MNFFANAFVALAQSLFFPAPALVAERYFPKQIRTLVVSLPLYFMMIGNGLGQWYPIYYMNDTLNYDTIYDRYEILKILGILAGLPTLFIYIPFYLWPPPINDSETENKETVKEN